MKTLGPLLVLTALTLSGADVPRPAPAFTINMVNASPIQLSGLKGKVVVLEFLFTTCPACQQSAKVLSRINNEFGAKGLTVLGIAFNPMSQMLVQDFVRDHRVNFPVGYSTDANVLGFMQIPSVVRWSVPQMAVIDRKGVIRAQTGPSGHVEAGQPNIKDEIVLKKLIADLLAEGQPATSKTKSTAPKKPAGKGSAI